MSVEEVGPQTGDWIQPAYAGAVYDPAVHEAAAIDPGWDPFAAPHLPLSSLVRLDTDTLAPLLDFQNRQGDKQLDLLDSQVRHDDLPVLLMGAQFRVSGLVGRTNREDRFSYLGRFPPDFTGSTASDLRIVHANQGFVAHVTPWATGYLETLFSDVFTFPDFKQGSFQVRQAYVVLGDPARSPLYAFIGKKNVSFGDMGTLNPFSQSTVWHYFAPLAEGAGVGFASQGLNVTVTGLNGSRGIRVSDSEERGHINNFAANGIYVWSPAAEVVCGFGGGYLHGTIYDGAVAEHLNPGITGERNGAWDVNGQLRAGIFDFAAEYVQTLNAWPVTGHRVIAWRAESAVSGHAWGLPWRLSGGWSEGIQGPQSAEFEFNKQLVIGLQWLPSPSVQVSLEYIRSIGFAPLIDITTVSDKAVRQNTILMGLVLVI